MKLKFLILALAISGCTTSPSSFIKNAAKLDDTDVCQNFLKDFNKLYRKKSSGTITALESQYLTKLEYQYDSRSLTRPRCERLVAENNKRILAGVAAVTAAVAVANYASKNSGGGYAPQGYAWDQFYDNSYNLIWRCRNKSNGQFAADSFCSGQYKVDSTWTGK